MLFITSTNAFASSADFDRSALEQAFKNIVEYSAYDYQTGTWILDHSIVEDGIFTEKQYNDAEKAGQMWYQYAEENSDVINNGQRALPAALVLVLKAIGAIVGTAVVTRIVDEIYTFGMSTACKNFQSISLFKDYCKANGYL